ncbi:MAG: phosphosulfolactate synthase [Pseudomonadota bacterium]
MTKPFSMIALPERSGQKPRDRGLTMMMDWGLPLETQRSWLDLIHSYVDLAKLVVGTARLYEEHYLIAKLELYEQFQVRPFLGGQFLEFVFETQGMAGAKPFFEEAVRLGIKAIEVSDNVVPLSHNERRELIVQACDVGLEVHGEVGSKTTQSDPAALVADARQCLDAGADVVLVEAAELMRNGRPDTELIEALRESLDLEKVIFELGGPWIANTTLAEHYQLKTFLVRTFGPDVNLANIMPDAIWETEACRVGLSVSGPLPAESG